MRTFEFYIYANNYDAAQEFVRKDNARCYKQNYVPNRLERYGDGYRIVAFKSARSKFEAYICSRIMNWMYKIYEKVYASE